MLQACACCTLQSVSWMKAKVEMLKNLDFPTGHGEPWEKKIQKCIGMKITEKVAKMEANNSKNQAERAIRCRSPSIFKPYRISDGCTIYQYIRHCQQH